MAQPIAIDSNTTQNILNINGVHSYADSVAKTYTPSHWIKWFDSTAYHSFDSTGYVSSIFSAHLLKPQHKEPLSLGAENRNWLFGMLLILAILYLYIQNNFYGRFTQVKRAFIIKRYYSQMVRDGNIFRERIVIPIYIIYFISFALLIEDSILYVIDVQKIPLSPLNFFFAILLFLMVFQIFKMWGINLLGKLFYTKAQTETYQLEHLLFVTLIGLFFIPFAWIYSYTHWVGILHIAGGVIVILSTIRLTKAIINWSKVFTLFKLFLYLCTLEILPIIIILKIITIGLTRYNG